MHSDISSDELFVKAPKKKLKKEVEPPKNTPVEIEIIIKENNIERKRKVNLSNTLEEIFGNSEDISIAYKNNTVSKLLTFADLGCLKENDEPFVLLNENKLIKEDQDDENFNLSVCHDSGQTLAIKFPKNQTIKDLVEFLRTTSKLNRNSLVLNRFRLNDGDFLYDVLENDDFLDFV
ncbi:hypothetical protein H312_01599 [Anncaliia algerae PRA339]|uniref:Uncharacterized protein n=1 Tax=Anncaliia algerae PRA339 TaxID=1288291 RepID=A0A059F1X0_9MICR|nr:hypothetical protein H312_01599 [Anncaliia algerae PRA339]